MTWSDIDTIALDLADATNASFPEATRLIYANSAQADIVGDIIGTDGRWQFDDTNHSNHPIATRTLTTSQQAYEFDDDFLKVQGVSVQDSAGNWHKLKSIDKNDVSVDLAEYQSITGIPQEYDKIGDSIFLYPAPNYTQAASLKVHFQRGPTTIASFGSNSPGIYTPKQIILAYMIALPYCQKYKQERVGLYEKKIMELRKDILDHYAKRAEDEKPGLRITNHSNK